jgi:hypothetical protein
MDSSGLKNRQLLKIGSRSGSTNPTESFGTRLAAGFVRRRTAQANKPSASEPGHFPAEMF